MTPRPTFVDHHITPSSEALWSPMGKVWATSVQQYPPRRSSTMRIIIMAAQAAALFSITALICAALWSATSQ